MEGGLQPAWSFSSTSLSAKQRLPNQGTQLEQVPPPLRPLNMPLKEFVYALRQLRKAPGFTVLAILTLALGIGASTAVFTAVDSVILKPLTYRDSGKLVVAWERVKFLGPNFPYGGPNPRHIDLWQKRATAFSGLTMLQGNSSGLALGKEHPRLVGTIRANTNLLDVLEVTPLLGRGFRAEDSVKGHDNVAILTYGLWQSLFHGDPEVIGKTLRLADTPRQIIGVLPRCFRFPNQNTLNSSPSNQAIGTTPEPAILVPAVIDLNKFDWNGEYGNWLALGRLKPGVSEQQAEAQLDTIEDQIVREMPPDQRDNEPNALRAYVQPMQEAVVGASRTGLWLLMAAVIGLMLIACVNLANAQLGRALSREREAAVRSALGAPSLQLVWSSLAESLLLAVAGGIAGVAFAFAGLELFRHYTPVDLPRMAEIHLNSSVLLFALALILGSSVLFGIVPALNILRIDPQKALQQNNSRTPGSRQSRQMRKWLIGAQVFGCTALLLITGLFAKSLLHLLQNDKGFQTGHVVIAEADFPGKTYDKDQSRVAFDDAVLDKLRSVPGVQSAAMVSAMPLAGETWIDGIFRADQPAKNPPLANVRPPLANVRWISPGYFETIREKLVAGRFFEERDRNLHSVIVSQAAAKAVWPHENPLGRQIKKEDKLYTVVGIVADARNNSLKLPPAIMLYHYYADGPPYETYFLVRSTQPADQLTGNVRQAIWDQDPDITIARVKTLDSQLTDSLAPERFQTSVLVAFGTGALLLAMLGIYAVLSYTVAGRKQEIGVRMALGATRQNIYALTIGEAIPPVLVGLAGGWAASILAGRLVQAMLYGVRAIDASVTATVAIVFLAAALAAAFLPARRAASVDAMEALRAE